MHRRFGLVFRVLTFLAVLPLINYRAVAQDNARSFAGWYTLGNAIADGSQVHVTMTLTLMNPGNADIKDGIVAVLTSGPNPALLGSFPAIKSLLHLGETTVSQTLSIPAAEYANWQHSHAPRLQFLVPSGDTAIAADILARPVILPGGATN